MFYHLEQIDQVSILRLLLAKITDESPDMFIVTADCDKLPFCLFSKTLASLLEDQNSSEMSGVSLPVPAMVTRNLIRIMKEGRAFATDKDELEISSYESVLGMNFKGMQIGFRKQKGMEKSHGGAKDDMDNEDGKLFDDHDNFLGVDLEESCDNSIVKQEVDVSLLQEADKIPMLSTAI